MRTTAKRFHQRRTQLFRYSVASLNKSNLQQPLGNMVVATLSNVCYIYTHVNNDEIKNKRHAMQRITQSNVGVTGMIRSNVCASGLPCNCFFFTGQYLAFYLP